ALRLRRAGQVVRPVVGRELRVAPVVVQRAAEARGAALRDGADVHAARAVLGRVVRALHLHFLNHVVVQGDDETRVGADVGQARPDELRRVARAPDAVARVALRVVRAAAEAAALERGRVRGDDAGQDAEVLERAAADDRQVVDLLGCQHALTGAGFRLDDFGDRRDRDRLGLGAD